MANAPPPPSAAGICLYTRLYIAYMYIAYIAAASQLVCLAAFQCYSYAPVTVSVAVGNIFMLFELSQQLTLQVFKYLPQLWHVATVLFCGHWQPLASCCSTTRRDNAPQDTSTAAVRQINENFKYARRETRKQSKIMFLFNLENNFTNISGDNLWRA